MKPDPAAAILAALDTVLAGARPGTLEALTGALTSAGHSFGWALVPYVVTFDQRRLLPLVDDGASPVPVEEEDGAGEAFRCLQAVTDRGGDRWLPLLDGAERIGVLRARRLPDTPHGSRPDEDGAGRDAPDEHGPDGALRRLASLTARLLGALGAHGDVLDLIRGAATRSVEAEIIWNLLPPLTFASSEVVVSALLEPAEKVAGDLFDYAATADGLQFALLDGTGHDLRAGLLASVALATYRNHRRRGADLATCGEMIDRALLDHTDGDGYATGVLGHLETATGRLDYLTAGHPAPLLMRAGRVVGALDQPGRGMFGLGPVEAEVGRVQLEPGDRVVLYTDGITEARDPDGGFFGLPRLVELLEQHHAAHRPAPESLRLVVRSVLDHQSDVLQDDATLMIVEWAPPVPLLSRSPRP